MVEKTFRLHRTLSNCRYEVLQTDKNSARHCIWDAVRAEPKEAYCLREELSDHDCRQNRNHCRTSNARQFGYCCRWNDGCPDSFQPSGCAFNRPSIELATIRLRHTSPTCRLLIPI